LIQNTIIYSEPEKITAPSGVIPIGVLKEESILDILLSLAFIIIRNLFLNSEIFYQQPGDAKTLYFAQYSADVSEDAPVIKS
jgi:hypothetical protein